MGERGSAEEDRGDEEQVKGHAGEGRQGAAKSNGKKDLEFLLLLLFWLNTGILSLRQSHIFPESKAGIFFFFPGHEAPQQTEEDGLWAEGRLRARGGLLHRNNNTLEGL